MNIFIRKLGDEFKWGEVMDLIYDQNVASEKLKSGTKYERLTAIIFKILSELDIVIHDIRLKGDGKTAQHQIDVYIEKEGNKKRVLVECKDYNKVIGIGIIRNFFGAISQIRPDESIVVTTVGYTRQAIKFAKDEDIKLAVLSEFQDTDWENRIKTIILSYKIYTPGIPRISWILQDNTMAKTIIDKQDNSNDKLASTRQTYFYDKNGHIISDMEKIISPIINQNLSMDEKTNRGTYNFDESMFVKIGEYLLEIVGFNYEFDTQVEQQTDEVDIGNKVARLLFRTLDDKINKAIFDTDLSKWTFEDNGEVVKKDNI